MLIITVGILILAGGLSSRFQHSDKWVDKILYPINGKPILNHIIDTLHKAFGDIVIVTKRERGDKYREVIGQRNVTIVFDDVDNVYHPLIGVQAGIKSLNTDYVVVIAGDLPYLKLEVVEMLIKYLDDYDLVSPIWSNGVIETLLVVYRRKHLESIVDKALKKEFSKPSDLIRSAYKLKFIPIDKFKSIDPNLRSFISINKLSDLELSKPSFIVAKDVVREYELIHEAQHPYWAGLNSYLSGKFGEAAKYFIKEADLYRDLGWTHLELHALYDVVNCLNKLKEDISVIEERIEELHEIIGW